MEFRHGGLVIDLPEDWADQSTLVFVAPREEFGALRTTANVTGPSEAVQINLFLDTFGDPRAILRDQAKQLEEIDEDFELLAEEEFTCGLVQKREPDNDTRGRRVG